MKIIESPRDGMQGMKKIISTENKAKYINALIEVGFDSIDFGSFVSAKAIPQLSDTTEVLKLLKLSETNTSLMVLVANIKGGEIASQYDEFDFLSFPFSISETFLKKNINSDFEKSKKIIDKLQNICEKTKKQLIVYMAMGFGNPYGDKWNLDVIFEWINFLKNLGIKIIPLSDITGEATKENITLVYSNIIKEFPEIEFGFHLHTKPDSYLEKIHAAYENGCRRFDTVLGGFGGCPMTGYELLANLNTFDLLNYCKNNNIQNNIDFNKLKFAEEIALKIF